jgi:RND family efflux transporter MFP subunit
VALTHRLLVALIVLTLAACGSAEPDVVRREELEPIAVTRWTDISELFAEYPPLVAGETSRFAIHLTRLDRFAPLLEGRVEVVLRTPSGQSESFDVTGPSRPGIFGVDVVPSRPGQQELVISVATSDLTDEHVVGTVTVHPDEAAARAAVAPAEEEGISFLKEQQWTLDFGTALVTEQSLRSAVSVPARIAPRPGGAADVLAPIAGRLTNVAGVVPGTTVSQGQELARLLPPPSSPAERPQVERAVTDAEAALALAVRDRERAERLTAAGAVPDKRLDEARTAETRAQAQLTAALASRDQYEASRSGEGSDGLFVIRAPIGGVIAYRDAVAGANVPPGATLFRIVDVAQVHVVGQVPESAIVDVRRVSDAEVEIPGVDGRMATGRLVGLGRVIDPATRTLPITFALDNRSLALPIGQPVTLNILTDPTPPGPVVPASALVDDAGRPIVFVHVSGEAFERRAVTVGARSGGLARIISGVDVGERIVTRGAYLVRLASLSTSVPAHGHVH